MSIRRRAARIFVITSVAAAAVAATVQPAQASYHLMKIREVFAGLAAHPNAHFVELQMYSVGQNFVAGKQVKIFNAAGSEIGAFTFTASLSNGANQASILVGTAEVQAAFSVTPDLTMTPVIPGAGGKACFYDPGNPYDGTPASDIDCVSWGNYSGSSAGTGTPAPAIPQGMSLERKISGGNPSLLEDGDDTGNSVADFQFAAPSPTRNGGGGGIADTVAPTSDIGKPTRGRSYEASKIKRFKGTATDGGSGVSGVEVALRQTLKNGCKWWLGNRFVSGGCNNKQFREATGLVSWKYVLTKQLKPSNEGKVRFYTLFARATDLAGNVESLFAKGRNANRFEVT